jgi:hypothetical protein
MVQYTSNLHFLWSLNRSKWTLSQRATVEQIGTLTFSIFLTELCNIYVHFICGLSHDGLNSSDYIIKWSND